MRGKKSRQPEHLSASLSGRPTTPEPIGDITAEGKLIPHSGRIVIRPAIPEWEESAPTTKSLSTHLASAGIEKITDAMAGAIVAEVMRVIVARAKARWWRKGKKVRGVIYGPDGEILREITFESKEGREDSS